MNELQRTAAIEYLSNGAKLSEVAAMCGVSRRDFNTAWLAGRAEAENGIDSELADFYRTAQAARARKRATLRAHATETAGSRESSDLLALCRELEAEEEPQALAEGNDVRARSPLLDTEDYSAETQELLKVASLALHNAFTGMVNEDAERRRTAA